MPDRILSYLFLVLLSGWAVADSDEAITGFVPPPDEYDWVQLTSDEWLKGEFISLYDDDLKFDSDILGMLSIDLEDVRHFRGSGDFGVSIHGEDLYAGKLQFDEDQVIILSDGLERRYSRQRLVAITAASDREFDKWSGDITLGVNITDGNTDIVEYNMMAGFQRRTPNSRAVVDYLGYFNETDGERAANSHRVNGTLDFFTGDRLFWRPFLGQYFRDRFQNIDHQSTIETGLGYRLVNTSRTDWEISAGVGVNFVEYDSVPVGQSSDNTSPAVTFATDLETEFTSWIDYYLLYRMTFLDNDSGFFQHHMLTTLSTELIGDLDLDISFVWDRTQKPRQRLDGSIPEKDDFRLMLGLALEF